MNGIVRRIGRLLFERTPAYSETLYRLCQKYADRYRSENDSDMRTNGELRLMRQILPGCRVVFDVGANVGGWTREALRVNAALEVHCFEPCRASFARLAAQGFPPQVRCNDFGLGSTARDVQLYVYGAQSALNSLYDRRGAVASSVLGDCATETVRLDTFESYCRSRGIDAVDFVKLDVEGHELEVLRGMGPRLDARRTRYVQFEYGGCNLQSRVFLRDLWALFEGAGYRLCKIYPRELREVAAYDAELENFRYQNWIAVGRG
jgi:FkbM family methyltransferase